MSYLLDKKIQRKKFTRIGVVILILAVLFYFHKPIFKVFSSTAHFVFRPVLVVGGGFKNGFSNFVAYFAFKSSLSSENDRLHDQLIEQAARISDYNTLVDENNKLKESMGRVEDKTNSVLAAILSKPNQSPYDTLVIDIGTDKNIHVGDMVFSLGGVPLGTIDSVFGNSSNVILFSSSGEKTQSIISGKDVFMQAVGRGGGNFEMILPRDFTLNKGDEVVLPGITAHTLAIVDSVISDPRDSFVKALLVSPVNIQEIKFVEVKK